MKLEPFHWNGFNRQAVNRKSSNEDFEWKVITKTSSSFARQANKKGNLTVRKNLIYLLKELHCIIQMSKPLNVLWNHIIKNLVYLHFIWAIEEQKRFEFPFVVEQFQIRRNKKFLKFDTSFDSFDCEHIRNSSTVDLCFSIINSMLGACLAQNQIASYRIQWSFFFL